MRFVAVGLCGGEQTDPTGYWSRKHQEYLRTAIAIAITAYTGGAVGGHWSFAGVKVTSANVLAVKMVGGFASGAVQSGDLKGGLAGAFSAGMFHGIGSLPDGLGKIAAHGVGGGIMAELQGGKFGHGFVSAGVTEALLPTLMAYNPGAFEQTAIAALVGGTASALSGGKFANGAVTAAFQMAFNHGAERLSRSDYRSRVLSSVYTERTDRWIGTVEEPQFRLTTRFDVSWVPEGQIRWEDLDYYTEVSRSARANAATAILAEFLLPSIQYGTQYGYTTYEYQVGWKRVQRTVESGVLIDMQDYSDGTVWTDERAWETDRSKVTAARRRWRVSYED